MFDTKRINKKNKIQLFNNKDSRNKIKGSDLIRNFDGKALKDMYKKELATAGNAYFSIGEGVARFGGSIVDTLASVGSVIDSGVADLLGFHEYADRLRSDTQAFVAKSYVSDLYDDFYDNTSLGRNIKENSYGYATTRQIGNGVGYTVGVIVTCVLTAGVGSAFSAGTAAVEVTPGMMAFWGGFAGFGKGADEAWGSGSGYWTGLGYASATAGWEALQFYLGGKINSFSAEGLTTAQNILARIGMDTVDGAAEGFIQPLLQSIYRGGYTDPNTGEYIEFSGDSSAWDKYVGMWKEQGGWKGVGTNAAIAGIMSTAGELGEFAFRKGEVIQGLENVNKQLTDGEHIELSVKQLEAVEGARKQLGLGAETSNKEVVQQALDIWKKLDYDKIDLKNMDLSTMKKLSDSIDGITDSSTRKEILAGLTGFKAIENLNCKEEFKESALNFIKNLSTDEAAKLDINTKNVLKELMQGELDGSDVSRSISFEELFDEYHKKNFGSSISSEESKFFEDLGNSKLSNVVDKIKRFTDEQIAEHRQRALEINDIIKRDGNAVVSVKSLNDLSSEFLEEIDDLSKVEFQIFGGLGKKATNIDNSSVYFFGDPYTLQSKYMSKSKHYLDRITYSGMETKEILGQIEDLCKKVDMDLSPKERARQIADILASEYSYKIDYTDIDEIFNIRASLKGLIDSNATGEKGLVCAGFSQAYKEMCEMCGIDCDYVRGKALHNGRQYGHAWNNLHIDGEEIPVDVTWMSSNNNKSWFGLSDDFINSHIADSVDVKDVNEKELFGGFFGKKKAEVVESVENPIQRPNLNIEDIDFNDRYCDTQIKNLGYTKIRINRFIKRLEERGIVGSKLKYLSERGELAYVNLLAPIANAYKYFDENCLEPEGKIIASRIKDFYVKADATSNFVTLNSAKELLSIMDDIESLLNNEKKSLAKYKDSLNLK